MFRILGDVKKVSSRCGALFLLVFALGLSAPVAIAQDDDSLPDPNQSQKKDSSDLPKTGLPALILPGGGPLLFGSGVAVRPEKRRRRRYDHDEWLSRVNPDRYG